MSLTARKRWLVASARMALLCPALAWSSGSLEELLRLQRPDVTRWQVQPLTAKVKPSGDVREVGRVGACTAVRFTDGRVYWYAVAGYRDVLVSAHAIESGAAESGGPEGGSGAA